MVDKAAAGRRFGGRFCDYQLTLSIHSNFTITPPLVGDTYHLLRADCLLCSVPHSCHSDSSSPSRLDGYHPPAMSTPSAALDDNADVDRLFGLVEPADDETSASSFTSTSTSSSSLAASSNIESLPSKASQEEVELAGAAASDPFDAHLEQTKAYNRKRRRAEAIDTSSPHTYVPRQYICAPSAVLIRTSTRMHPLFAAKPQKTTTPQQTTTLFTRSSSAFPHSPAPPPAPPPSVSCSSSSPRLLSDDQMLKVLTPAPYYSRTGVQDFDQILSTDKTHVSAYVDLADMAESADYIRVPSFSLGDGGVHGPHISDHSVHKSRHDGYWEERLRKLSAQHPRQEYYNSLPTYSHNSPDSSTTSNGHVSSSASSASHPPIFAGCLMYIDGRTEGASELSAHSLTALIRLHGGSTSPLMSRTHTTHVIATNLTLSKHRKEMKQTVGMGKGRGRVQVVKPEWVRECIRQGKLLDERQWRVVKDVQQRELPWTTAAAEEGDNSPAGEHSSCSASRDLHG